MCGIVHGRELVIHQKYQRNHIFPQFPTDDDGRQTSRSDDISEPSAETCIVSIFDNKITRAHYTECPHTVIAVVRTLRSFFHSACVAAPHHRHRHLSIAPLFQIFFSYSGRCCRRTVVPFIYFIAEILDGHKTH